MTTTFAIHLLRPRSGWVDVDLTLGAHRVHFAASHVLNDPVEELAGFGLLLMQPQDVARRSVTFWLEPAGYELLASDEAPTELRLRYAKYAYPRLGDAIDVARIRLDRRACGAEIARCLRSASAEFVQARSENRHAWNQPFPEKLLSLLESTLRS